MCDSDSCHARERSLVAARCIIRSTVAVSSGAPSQQEPFQVVRAHGRGGRARSDISPPSQGFGGARTMPRSSPWPVGGATERGVFGYIDVNGLWVCEVIIRNSSDSVQPGPIGAGAQIFPAEVAELHCILSAQTVISRLKFDYQHVLIAHWKMTRGHAFPQSLHMHQYNRLLRVLPYAPGIQRTGIMRRAVPPGFRKTSACGWRSRSPIPQHRNGQVPEFPTLPSLARIIQDIRWEVPYVKR